MATNPNPNTIISYPAATPPLDGSEAYAAWQNGAQKQVTGYQLAQFLLAGIGTPTDESQVGASLAAQLSALSASQAAVAVAMQNNLPAAVAAGGALPFEVASISGGVGTGTGGTPGTYAGGITGGPPGFRWNYTIDSTGKLAGYEIVNPGLSTSNVVPTLSLPSGGLTGATVPTATVSTIPVGRIFSAPSSDGSQILAWGNSAGALASAPFGGVQLSIPTAAIVLSNRLGIGERLRRVSIGGGMAGGATFYTEFGATLGLNIPAGQSGVNATVQPLHPLLARVGARYAGATVRIRDVHSLSAGWAAAKALSTTQILHATFRDGTPDSETFGTLVRNDIIADRLYREATFTLAANIATVGHNLVVASSSSTASAHFIKLGSTDMVCDAVPAGVSWTASDVTAALREALQFDDIGPLDDEELNFLPGAGGGATASTDADGRPNTLLVPAGQTGIGANVQVVYHVPRPLRELLAGARFQIIIPVTHRAGMVCTLLPIVNRDGSNQLFPSSIEYRQISPTEREYVCEYSQSALTSANLTLAPYVKIDAGSPAAPVQETITLGKPRIGVAIPNDNFRSAGQATRDGLFHRARPVATSGNLLDLIGTPRNTIYVPVGPGMSSRYDTRGNPIGWNLPTGVTPSGTVLQPRIDFDGAGLTSRRLLMSFYLNTSTNLARVPSFIMHKEVNGVESGPVSFTVIYNKQISANQRLVMVAYTVDGTETGLWPFFGPGGGAAATSDEYVEIADMRMRVVYNDMLTTALDDTLKIVRRAAVSEASATAIAISTNAYYKTVTVKADGTGDYTHPKLALDAIRDAGPTRRYKVAIYPGTYDGYAEWHTKDYVDLIGIGRRDDIIITYALPDSATLAQIVGTSTMWHDSNSEVANLTIMCLNMRYAMHADTNGLKPGSLITRITNCVIIHQGITSPNNTGSGAWQVGSQYAIGAGNSSGQKIILRGVSAKGPGGGFSYHLPGNGNLVPYSSATFTDAEDCRFEATVAGRPAFSIKPICVGAGDRCRLVGNTFVGDVLYTDGEWLDGTDTTSNRAQVEVSGHGNSGFNFVNGITGGAPGGAAYAPVMTGVGA